MQPFDLFLHKLAKNVQILIKKEINSISRLVKNKKFKTKYIMGFNF